MVVVQTFGFNRPYNISKAVNDEYISQLVDDEARYYSDISIMKKLNFDSLLYFGYTSPS